MGILALIGIELLDFLYEISKLRNKSEKVLNYSWNQENIEELVYSMLAKGYQQLDDFDKERDNTYCLSLTSNTEVEFWIQLNLLEATFKVFFFYFANKCNREKKQLQWKGVFLDEGT